MRAPDTKFYDKRKFEVTNKLVEGLHQKAVNAEALAMERKREVNMLRVSNSRMRILELQTTVEEYFNEILRLRKKLKSERRKRKAYQQRVSLKERQNQSSGALHTKIYRAVSTK